MFEESAPPSPNQALIALPQLDPEWQPIFHVSNQVVLYNPTSHALTIHKAPNLPDRPNSPCPYCHRPLPPGFGLHERDEADIHLEHSHSRASDYFELLAIANETSRPSNPPPLSNGHGRGLLQAFFQEEYRLGMGANGTVFLCQKIAIGQSHSYLLGILREIRLLETLRHRNIITYHHAWLETKIPTLHVLMQWAEGGSLDDFIDVRLGRPTRLPHMRSATPSPSTSEIQSPSARIRAFRAMKRAPPEEREAPANGGRTTGPILKAVHLLSVEEVKSLFSDVVEGLAFLHDRSILHLDLKPGNVLPRAMLSDFGTSRDMLHSSGPRSGNTGTLEYASPESLPSPRTGLLQEIDSKSDMWSLGMILHKMLFFRLPYRYATEGEASATDEADKMDKLEREILAYTGFRSTSSLATQFESRRLPRAFLILLEGLLSVSPSVRPTSERIISAMREGRFNPVTSARKRSSGSLVSARRSSGDESRHEQSPNASRALAPATGANESLHRESAGQGDLTATSALAVRDEKSPLLRLPSSPVPEDDEETAPKNVSIDLARVLGLRASRDAWIGSAKACILAAKVQSNPFTFPHAVSIASFWDAMRGRPALLAVLMAAAMVDTFSENLQVSVVLAAFHVGIMWAIGHRGGTPVF
ncbi:kinase-like protein [Melanogaster broomeanus]|nr:kinase-like protein [Melanogaster broomeanus]